MSSDTPVFPSAPLSRHKPVILMSMGNQTKAGHEYQVMTHKYIRPIVDIADCVPILLPTSFGVENIEQYLDMADGVYLTGAATNIDPTLYGQENMTPEKTQDRARDLFDIPLIKAALNRGLPLFGVCRGMQELNVALGGDMHQKLYALSGAIEHRENGETETVEQQYAERHKIRILPDTWFAKTLGKEEIGVNSLHGQSIKTLAPGVEVLAYAEDGVAIEAIHMPGQPALTFGVQWHPEWRASGNVDSVKIFQAFGDACRIQAMRRS